MIKRVAVGVSGGVDSAVTALLLKNKGYEVIGVFMQNWDEEDETGLCSVSKDRADAQYVCQKLSLPFHQVNFVKQYWSEVFSYFLQEYQSGCTPNPDIMCNRHIKFNAFLKYCFDDLKVHAVATGHYARTSYGTFLEKRDASKAVRLKTAVDQFKDQTFFLSQVSQNALKNIMFPLGDYQKTQVKEIATKYNLHRVIKKKESTGICFIGKRNFQDFISEYLPSKPGPMIDLTNGKTIHEHCGLHLWTIGQCCRIEGYTTRYFVAKKSVAENTIYVVPGTDHPALFTKTIFTEASHWIAGCPLNDSNMIICRFRFQHTKPTVSCRLYSFDNRLLVVLNRPLKAITPGQFAVFYKDDECLGGARILHPGPSLFSLKAAVPANYKEYHHHIL